ncbi:hypothetical protein FB451DRAFT_1460507 [Mycena latifolia]|nr:hypothetical protein FB451DRAFT_1460507 [Mycena latifolia]
MDFLHRYRDSIPFWPIPCPTGGHWQGGYASFASIILWFWRDSLATALVDATPGVRRVLTASWRFLLSIRGEHHQDAVTKVATLVMSLSRLPSPIDSANLEEMVDGAGGTLHDLASLLVLHINYSILPLQSPIPAEILCRAFVMAVVFMNGPLWDNDGPTNSALLSAGIVAAEVTTLCSFVNVLPPFDYDDEIETDCFPHLLDLLQLRPGYPSIGQALKAGLLRAIIERGGKPAFPHPHLKTLLTKILPQATVYHSVLTQLQSAMLDLKSSAVFRKSEIYPEWARFAVLALERFEVMTAYDAERHDCREACSNMACGAIKPRIKFRRCSLCQQAYYCSPQCQAVDWRAGGHRDYCQALTSFRLTREDQLNKRDASFLRALVHHDYMRNRGVILRRQIVPKSRPAPNGPTVVFAYLDGHCVLDSLNLPPEYYPPRDAVFRDMAARARRSRGTMELHVVFILEGQNLSMKVIPLRTRTAAVRDELTRISNVIPPTVEEAQLEHFYPEIHRRFRALLDIPVEEIH